MPLVSRLLRVIRQWRENQFTAGASVSTTTAGQAVRLASMQGRATMEPTDIGVPMQDPDGTPPRSPASGPWLQFRTRPIGSAGPELLLGD